MWRWFKRLLKPRRRDEDLLTLERETQSLRLDLEEKERLAANLKGEIERLREGEDDRIIQAVGAKMEALITDAATPVVQLLTQAHLLETGKPIQAKDVLSVAMRLVRLLEDMGLEIGSKVGEMVDYDPTLHEPLGSETITPVESVVVKFVGIRYKGEVVRKATVARE